MSTNGCVAPISTFIGIYLEDVAFWQNLIAYSIVRHNISREIKRMLIIIEYKRKRNLRTFSVFKNINGASYYLKNQSVQPISWPKATW